MVQAYILVQTEVGKAADVATSIAKITGVMQADDVTGPYDVIVRAEADNVDDLGKLVVAQIQGVSRHHPDSDLPHRPHLAAGLPGRLGQHGRRPRAQPQQAGPVQVAGVSTSWRRPRRPGRSSSVAPAAAVPVPRAGPEQRPERVRPARPRTGSSRCPPRRARTPRPPRRPAPAPGPAQPGACAGRSPAMAGPAAARPPGVGVAGAEGQRRVQARGGLVGDHDGPQAAQLARGQLVIGHHDDAGHSRRGQRGRHRVGHHGQRQVRHGAARPGRRGAIWPRASTLTGITSDQAAAPGSAGRAGSEDSMGLILPRHGERRAGRLAP